MLINLNSSQPKTANNWIFHTPPLQYIKAISGGGHRLTSESPLYNITCAYKEGGWFFILFRSWRLSEPWGWGPNELLSLSSISTPLGVPHCVEVLGEASNVVQQSIWVCWSGGAQYPSNSLPGRVLTYAYCAVSIAQDYSCKLIITSCILSNLAFMCHSNSIHSEMVKHQVQHLNKSLESLSTHNFIITVTR